MGVWVWGFAGARPWGSGVGEGRRRTATSEPRGWGGAPQDRDLGPQGLGRVAARPRPRSTGVGKGRRTTATSVHRGWEGSPQNRHLGPQVLGKGAAEPPPRSTGVGKGRRNTATSVPRGWGRSPQNRDLGPQGLGTPLSMRRAAHVDALQDHGEGGAIEGDLGPPRLHRRELNAALLQRARNDAPRGAVVEEQLQLLFVIPASDQAPTRLTRPAEDAAGFAQAGDPPPPVCVRGLNRRVGREG